MRTLALIQAHRRSPKLRELSARASPHARGIGPSSEANRLPSRRGASQSQRTHVTPQTLHGGSPSMDTSGAGLRAPCCLLIGCGRKAPRVHWLLPAGLGGLENSSLKRAGLPERRATFSWTWRPPGVLPYGTRRAVGPAGSSGVERGQARLSISWSCPPQRGERDG